jgi:hypothetical protein
MVVVVAMLPSGGGCSGRRAGTDPRSCCCSCRGAWPPLLARPAAGTGTCRRVPGCTGRPVRRPGTPTAGPGGRRRWDRRFGDWSRTAARHRRAGCVRRARCARRAVGEPRPPSAAAPSGAVPRVTFLRPALNRRREAFTWRGSVTRTSASPPETRSARLDSTLICGAGTRASAGAAAAAATTAPAHAASASARSLRAVFKRPPTMSPETFTGGQRPARR